MVSVAHSEHHYIRVEVQDTRLTLRKVRKDDLEFDPTVIQPVPVFADDLKLTPVTLSPGPDAGAVIPIVGRGLVAEETYLCTTTPPTEMAGASVTINGVAIQLLYASPTQIYGQIPFAVDGNITVRVSTPNGFVEKSI